MQISAQQICTAKIVKYLVSITACDSKSVSFFLYQRLDLRRQYEIMALLHLMMLTFEGSLLIDALAIPRATCLKGFFVAFFCVYSSLGSAVF